MLRDQETKKSAVLQPLAYALEPRLLFDGAAIADATTAIVYREAVAQVYQHDNTATEINTSLNTSLNATSNAASTSDTPDTPPAATSAQQTYGHVQLETNWHAPLGGIMRAIGAVLVRESGF